MILLPIEVKKLHFGENDECQYSLSELLDNSLSDSLS